MARHTVVLNLTAAQERGLSFVLARANAEAENSGQPPVDTSTYLQSIAISLLDRSMQEETAEFASRVVAALMSPDAQEADREAVASAAGITRDKP